MSDHPPRIKQESLAGRLDKLTKEHARFYKTLKHEGNSDSMDAFCLSALKKIEAEMDQVSAQLKTL